jgi:DNA mismatch repair ATPase MutS
LLRCFRCAEKAPEAADEHADKFESDGFTAFRMLKTELNDEYFAIIENHFKELAFKDGIIFSAGLRKGNESTDYILRKPEETNESWAKRLFGKKPRSYAFYAANDDYSGSNDQLWHLRERGINPIANVLAQSADHINSFIEVLRIELTFYIACLNLYEQLARLQEPITFPIPGVPTKADSQAGTVRCLPSLRNKSCETMWMLIQELVVTGANQGGKSTFLRSAGLSQLMMQCGMFVPAEFFCSNICDGIFTHFKREEDVNMKSGKLEEELGRISIITDNVKASSMVLFNESFSSTNERDGSEIARQITRAMLEKKIKVFFVTHLFEFAHGCYKTPSRNVMFLRAERQSDGKRTFKLIEGERCRQATADLYNRIFKRIIRPDSWFRILGLIISVLCSKRYKRTIIFKVE